MGFRLSTEARHYFRGIEEKSQSGTFASLWDRYYLCLMAGLTMRKLGDEPSEGPFVEEFIRDYQDSRYEILAALVAAELERKGVPLDDEDRIRGQMLALLNSKPGTHLTEEGMTLMNRYAQGGFESIRDRIKAPRELSDFLKEYHATFVAPFGAHAVAKP